MDISQIWMSYPFKAMCEFWAGAMVTLSLDDAIHSGHVDAADAMLFSLPSLMFTCSQICGVVLSEPCVAIMSESGTAVIGQQSGVVMVRGDLSSSRVSLAVRDAQIALAVRKAGRTRRIDLGALGGDVARVTQRGGAAFRTWSHLEFLKLQRRVFQQPSILLVDDIPAALSYIRDRLDAHRVSFMRYRIRESRIRKLLVRFIDLQRREHACLVIQHWWWTCRNHPRYAMSRRAFLEYMDDLLQK